MNEDNQEFLSKRLPHYPFLASTPTKVDPTEVAFRRMPNCTAALVPGIRTWAFSSEEDRDWFLEITEHRGAVKQDKL